MIEILFLLTGIISWKKILMNNRFAYVYFFHFHLMLFMLQGPLLKLVVFQYYKEIGVG